MKNIVKNTEEYWGNSKAITIITIISKIYETKWNLLW